jgi:hypothetical protein
VTRPIVRDAAGPGPGCVPAWLAITDSDEAWALVVELCQEAAAAGDGG